MNNNKIHLCERLHKRMVKNMDSGARLPAQVRQLSSCMTLGKLFNLCFSVSLSVN